MPSSGAAFPVTVPHRFGSTTIPAEPKRVVSLGYTDRDAILALGVVPVAIREFTGEKPSATWRRGSPRSRRPTPLCGARRSRRCGRARPYFVWSSQELRGRFFSSLGLTVPAEIDQLAGPNFSASVSTEELSKLNWVDVVALITASDEETCRFEALPGYAALRPVREGRVCSRRRSSSPIR